MSEKKDIRISSMELRVSVLDPDEDGEELWVTTGIRVVEGATGFEHLDEVQSAIRQAKDAAKHALTQHAFKKLMQERQHD